MYARLEESSCHHNNNYTLIAGMSRICHKQCHSEVYAMCVDIMCKPCPGVAGWTSMLGSGWVDLHAGTPCWGVGEMDSILKHS